MIELQESKPFSKLKMDIERYYIDHRISGRFSIFKLFMIIDFWPVFIFRMIEILKDKRNIIYNSLRFGISILKIIVDGISNSRIYTGANIGGGILLHQSLGVVISPGVVIGNNCTFFAGACVVYKANDKGTAAPKIGNNVKLMMGCKVIGDVKVGDNVWVGANAIVIESIPDDCIAVGIPAITKNRKILKNNSF